MDFFEAYKRLKEMRAHRRAVARRLGRAYTPKSDKQDIAALSRAIDTMHQMTGCFGPGEMLGGRDKPGSDKYTLPRGYE
jgi:hypothetical protein